MRRSRQNARETGNAGQSLSAAHQVDRGLPEPKCHAGVAKFPVRFDPRRNPQSGGGEGSLVIEGSRNPVGGPPRADRDGEAQALSTPLSGGTTMPSGRIRTGRGPRKPRRCLMLLENPLRAADRLVGEIEPAG